MKNQLNVRVHDETIEALENIYRNDLRWLEGRRFYYPTKQEVVEICIQLGAELLSKIKLDNVSKTEAKKINQYFKEAIEWQNQ